MSISYGDFDSMMLYYLKQLSEDLSYDVMLWEDGTTGVYAVSSVKEYVKVAEERGAGKVRPVTTMTAEEVLSLLFLRHMDLFEKVRRDANQKNLPTGKQSGDKHTSLDAGTDQAEKG